MNNPSTPAPTPHPGPDAPADDGRGASTPPHSRPLRPPSTSDEATLWTVRVAVDRPIDALLDYVYQPLAVPDEGDSQHSAEIGTADHPPGARHPTPRHEPLIGERLRVPLRGQQVLGIVVATRAHNGVDAPAHRDGSASHPGEAACTAARPLDTAEALDRDAALDGATVALARFVAQHYHQPLGPCLAAALPPAWRRPAARCVTDHQPGTRGRVAPSTYALTPLGLAVWQRQRPGSISAAAMTASPDEYSAPPTDAEITQAGRGLQASQIDLLERIHVHNARRSRPASSRGVPAEPGSPTDAVAANDDQALDRSRVERLVRRGLVERRDAPEDTPEADNPVDARSPAVNPVAAPALTAAQRRVLDELRAWLPTPDRRAADRLRAQPGPATHQGAPEGRPATPTVALLEGVTGSGKTRIYEALIETLFTRAAAQGDPPPGVLVLTPEIGLTPQLVARLRAAFGDAVVESHSGQSAAERARVFAAVRAGRHRIVVGTRSAIFMPIAHLALIIVDEEHDGAFKQTQSPLYNARDLAVWRGRHANALVVLGSATPSLESLVNAAAGRYRHLVLDHRPDGSPPPRLQTIDLRRHPPDEGLSAPLLDAIGATLARDEHVFLLLNRRGFAPALLCTACGWNADCPSCDAHLTVHHSRTPHQAARSARLRCHHCGHGEPAPRLCPSCGATLDTRGLGTQRIERALSAHFPGRGVLRLDRDALAGPRDLARAIQRLRSERGLLVVGTQLIAKGHDLPDVGLVGIVDADAGWFSADLRAAEHTAQQILQVAGRARRRVVAPTDDGANPSAQTVAPDTPPVLLQTWVPEHPIVHALLAGRWPPVAERLIAERQAAGLPPFGRAALVRLDGRDARDTQDIARVLAGRLRECIATPAGGGTRPAARVLGPAPALIARVQNRHREHILLLGRSHADLHPLLDAAVDAFAGLKTGRRIRLTLDVDPLSLS